jgi:hypothetical protein
MGFHALAISMHISFQFGNMSIQLQSDIACGEQLLIQSSACCVRLLLCSAAVLLPQF